MANNLGDFDAAAVIYGKFTSVRVDTGAPATLASSPVLSVYKDASITQSTTGVTMTADFDGVTGLNHFAVDTSADGSFYSAGSFFDVVITTGTVNAVSAVGYCVGQFTIRKTADLKPTTAGRALDVSAGGEAGVDWANVGSPTTANTLSATTIATSQVVASVTGAVGSVTGSVASVTGAVGSVTGNVGGNVVGSVGSVTGAVGSVTGAVGSVTGAVGSVTGNVGGNVVGTVATVNALAANSVNASALATDAVTEIQTGLAVPGSAMTLTSAERTSVADALLDRNLATGTDSGSPTVRTVRQALRFLRNKWSIAAGTLTVTKEDDSTSSWTAAISTTAGNPVSGSDPA